MKPEDHARIEARQAKMRRKLVKWTETPAAKAERILCELAFEDGIPMGFPEPLNDSPEQPSLPVSTLSATSTQPELPLT